MKPNNLFTLSLLIVSLSFSAEEWHLSGLAGHYVNCITVVDSGRVIAGTDKGLFIKDGADTWLEISTLLPVTDVVMAHECIVAALAGGSDSDGLYCGKAIKGPPYYKLSLIDYMTKPQALEYKYTLNETPILFAGNSVGIQESAYLFGKEKFDTLSEVKTPPFCFGVVSPVCADLHIFLEMLYVGGFDSMSTDTGCGNLLWMKHDSMTVLIPDLKVTSLTKDASTDCVTVQMYIGTIDSGIYFYSPYMSHPPVKLTSGPNNEKIEDLVTIPLPIAERKSLCAAVKSGIYFHHRKNNTWKELGDISAKPNCLASGPGSATISGTALYAGTDNGVYQLDSFITGTVEYSPKKLPPAQIYFCNTGKVVSISLFRKQKVSIELVNCSGKIITVLSDRYLPAGHHTVSMGNRFGNGVYIVRIVSDSEQISKKIVMIK